jgi:hypothetical protein
LPTGNNQLQIYADFLTLSSTGNRNTCPIAEIRHPASRTARRNRVAVVLSKGDKQVIYLYPVFRRELLSQYFFGLIWSFCSNIAKSVEDSMHVRINTNSGTAKA